MVGFFFTGSAIIGILVSQFLAGRSDRKGDRKSLIVFCCLLGVFACVLFAWNRNYFILLFVGVFLSSFGSDRQPADVRPCPRACRPHRAGSGDVQLDTARAGVACVVIGPPARLRTGNGFWLYGNVPQRGGSLRGVWRNGMVLPAFHA